MNARITSVRVWIVDVEELVDNPTLWKSYKQGDYSGLSRTPYLAHGYTPELMTNVENTLHEIVAEWDNTKTDWFHDLPRWSRLGDIIEITTVDSNNWVQTYQYGLDSLVAGYYNFTLVDTHGWTASSKFS